MGSCAWKPLGRKPVSTGKRLVYVPEALVEDAMRISRSSGESMSRFVEEALRQAVRANHLGYSHEQAAEFLEVIHAQRILGGAFVPLDVLEYLTSKACEAGGGEMQARWYESGKLHGEYLKEKFGKPVQSLKKFLEATRWDLSEVDVKEYEHGVIFRCISTVLTKERTESLAKFIEGAMHSIGFQTEKSDCMKGMIVFRFKR